jgi:hypothetical protein
MIMEKRLLNLQENRKVSVESGLLEKVMQIDLDINSTSNSIEVLKSVDV